jgi:hypothetical protein
VVVAEEVKEAVEGEDSQLCLLGMTRRPRLTARDASGDHDLA